jgi:hypothetical protein
MRKKTRIIRSEQPSEWNLEHALAAKASKQNNERKKTKHTLNRGQIERPKQATERNQLGVGEALVPQQHRVFQKQSAKRKRSRYVPESEAIQQGKKR